MNKGKCLIRRLPILVLVLVLVALPLMGTACSDDKEGIEASFTASLTTGTAPLTVDFTDTSTGDIVAWQWDFNNDGEVDSVEKNPTYTFEDEALYTVTLKVIGSDEEDTATISINATGVVYQEMSLDLNNPFPETDPAGQAAEKFKELIELYTNGNVSVDIFHNGQLYDMYGQFEYLKEGAIDAAIQTPAILQNLDPNLAILTSLRGLITDADMGREVLADPDVLAFLRETFADYNVHYVGGIEAYLMNGFFSPNTDLTDYADFTGHTYWWGRPGSAAPIEEMFSPNTVYYSMDDVFAHIMNQDIDIVTFPPNMAYDYGLYNFFNYCLLTMVYAPNSLCFNLDTWNDMEPELQELITDVIMPEVQTYVQGMVVEAHKQALLVINTKLDAVRVISPEREEEVWNLIQTRDDYMAMKNKLDADTLAVIESYRPDTPVFAQDEIDILTFANIPIPD